MRAPCAPTFRSSSRSSTESRSRSSTRQRAPRSRADPDRLQQRVREHRGATAGRRAPKRWHARRMRAFLNAPHAHGSSSSKRDQAMASSPTPGASGTSGGDIVVNQARHPRASSLAVHRRQARRRAPHGAAGRPRRARPPASTSSPVGERSRRHQPRLELARHDRPSTGSSRGRTSRARSSSATRPRLRRT